MTGADPTFTVTEAFLGEPSKPVQVTVYEVSAIRLPVDTDPDVAPLLTKPGIEQELATVFVDDQVSVLAVL